MHPILRRTSALATSLLAAGLLAACSSAPSTDGQAAVEDRSSGAASSGIGGSGVTTVSRTWRVATCVSRRSAEHDASSGSTAAATIVTAHAAQGCCVRRSLRFPMALLFMEKWYRVRSRAEEGGLTFRLARPRRCAM